MNVGKWEYEYAEALVPAVLEIEKEKQLFEFVVDDGPRYTFEEELSIMDFVMALEEESSAITPETGKEVPVVEEKQEEPVGPQIITIFQILVRTKKRYRKERRRKRKLAHDTTARRKSKTGIDWLSISKKKKGCGGKSERERGRGEGDIMIMIEVARRRKANDILEYIRPAHTLTLLHT